MRTTKKVIIGTAIALIAFLPAIASAQSPIGGPNFWKVISGVLQPISNAYSLLIGSLAGHGVQCLQTDNGGNVGISGFGACGSGGGGGGSSTIVTGISPIVVTQVGVNATTSCPTCLTTSTGLTIANFATSSVSQFVNDAGYVTSTGASAPTGTPFNFPYFLSGGTGLSVTSSITQSSSTGEISVNTTTFLNGAILNINGQSSDNAVSISSGNLNFGVGWGIKAIGAQNASGEFFTNTGVGIGNTAPVSKFTVGVSSTLPQGITATLVNLGGLLIQGGNVSGTLLGANLAAGIQPDFINFEENSSSFFNLTSSSLIMSNLPSSTSSPAILIGQNGAIGSTTFIGFNGTGMGRAAIGYDGTNQSFDLTTGSGNKDMRFYVNGTSLNNGSLGMFISGQAGNVGDVSIGTSTSLFSSALSVYSATTSGVVTYNGTGEAFFGEQNGSNNTLIGSLSNSADQFLVNNVSIARFTATNFDLGGTTDRGGLSVSTTLQQTTTSSLILAGGNTIVGGSASGTYYGANAPLGFNGDFENLEVNSSSVFRNTNSSTIIGSNNLFDAGGNKYVTSTAGGFSNANASSGIAVSTTTTSISIQNIGVTSLTGAGCITFSNTTGTLTTTNNCISTSTYNASITIATVGPLTGGGLLANGGTLTIGCATCLTSAPATTTINNFTSQSFAIQGDGISVTSTVNGSTTIFSTIGDQGEANYYFTNVASDVASNKVASDTPVSVLASTTVAGLSNGTTSIQQWATIANVPSLPFIPAGLFDVHIDAAQTAGTKPTFLYAVVNDITSTGTVVATILQTENGPVLTGTLTDYDLLGSLTDPYTMASTTDRIQVNVIASVSGALLAPTVQVYYGGTSADSRLELPASTADVTNFIPYVGAIKNVNLGSNSLSLSGTLSGGPATFVGNATTTNLSVTAVTNALGLFGSGGVLSAYGGSTTNGGSNCLLSVALSATGTLSNTNGACSGGGGGVNINQAGASSTYTIALVATTSSQPSITTSTATVTLRLSNTVRLATWIVAPAGGDFTTIQPAMDACGVTGGGTIYIQQGTYAQATVGLLWKGNNCKIYGINGTTTITFTGATTGFKTNSSSSAYSGDEIHNIQILGDTTTGGRGIDMSDMSHAIYDGITMDSVATPIVIHDTKDVTFYNALTNFNFTTIKTIGIDGSSTEPWNANTFGSGFIGCSTASCIGIQDGNSEHNTFHDIAVEPAGSPLTGSIGVHIFDSNVGTNPGNFGNQFNNLYLEGNATPVKVELGASCGAGECIAGDSFNGGISDVNGTLVIPTSTGVSFLNFNNNFTPETTLVSHFGITGQTAAPSMAAGSVLDSHSNDNSGHFSVTTSAATKTLTFAVAWPVQPECYAWVSSGTFLGLVAKAGTASIVITAGSNIPTTTVVSYWCVGNNSQN